MHGVGNGVVAEGGSVTAVRVGEQPPDAHEVGLLHLVQVVLLDQPLAGAAGHLAGPGTPAPVVKALQGKGTGWQWRGGVTKG